MGRLVKLLFLLVFWCCSSFAAYAQFVLDKQYNMLRGKDKLTKQEVTYQNPGRSGENVLWNFSGQKPVNKNYELAYEGDTVIVGKEHGTAYEYVLNNDSLFQIGYRNNTTSFDFEKPELLIKYPFGYGSKVEDYFGGHGNYCYRLKMQIQGKTSALADAYGTLILPTKDILRNVLRVHTTRIITQKSLSGREIHLSPGLAYSPDSVEFHLANDSVRFQLEIYRWYAEGYRYPVFETIENIIYKNGKPDRHFNTAFYYAPVDQYYDLDNDPENVVRRIHAETEVDGTKGTDAKKKKGKASGLSDDQLTYNAYVEQGNLLLAYLSGNSVEADFLLFDIQGRLLKAYPKRKVEEGYHTETFSLEGINEQELVLQIYINGEILGVKLMNKH